LGLAFCLSMPVTERLASISLFLFFNKHLFIQVIMSTYSDYRKNMIHRFWKYQNEAFSDWTDYFEKPFHLDGRPPVFLKKKDEFLWLVDQLEIKYGL